MLDHISSTAYSPIHHGSKNTLRLGTSSETRNENGERFPQAELSRKTKTFKFDNTGKEENPRRPYRDLQALGRKRRYKLSQIFPDEY